MGFVALFQPSKDGHRVFDTGFSDEDLLEAALQCCILLNVFAVLVEGRGTNQAKFTAREHGLEHVGRSD